MEEVQNSVTEKHFCVTLFVHRNWTQQNPDSSSALKINLYVLLHFHSAHSSRTSQLRGGCDGSDFPEPCGTGSGWRKLSQVISLLLCTAADGERSTRPAAVSENCPAGIRLPAQSEHRIMVSALCCHQTGSPCWLCESWTASQQPYFRGSPYRMSPSLGAYVYVYFSQLTSKIGTFHSCRAPKQCPKCARLWGPRAVHGAHLSSPGSEGLQTRGSRKARWEQQEKQGCFGARELDKPVFPKSF